MKKVGRKSMGSTTATGSGLKTYKDSSVDLTDEPIILWTIHDFYYSIESSVQSFLPGGIFYFFLDDP